MILRHHSGPNVYASQLDIPDRVRDGAIGLLQARLSDTLDLQRQMKQAQWNTRGPGFFSLQQMFETVSAEIDATAGQLAQRIAVLGGVADGRIQTTADATSLYPYPLELRDGRAHLIAIATVLGQYTKNLRADVESAAELPDANTTHLLTQISLAADRQWWLVEAHLTHAADGD